MSSINKILSLFLIVQVALLLGMRMGDDDGLKLTSIMVLETLDSDTVSEITIMGAPKEGTGPDQESVVLAKVNGQWTIGGTDGFAADTKKVDELVTSLKALQSRTVVLEGAAYHDKLEVGADKFQRKVSVKDGAKTHTFYVGTSPSFKNVHIRLDGSDQVLLVNEFGASQLGSRAWHWVDRKYQDIPDDQVWQVRIDNAKGSLQLDRDPVSKNWAALGISGELDANTIRNLVNKARTLNLETPVGKTLKPEHGFDAPLATITLTTGTATVAGAPPPSTETVTVKIGKKLEAHNQYFVKSSKSEYVVRVAGWAVSPLIEKGKDDLIKKAE